MKTLTLCKTEKFHFITLFSSQEAFFQFMTLVPFVSYTELSVLSKLTLSNKILKLLFPHLYDVHCQSYTDFSACLVQKETLNREIADPV